MSKFMFLEPKSLISHYLYDLQAVEGEEDDEINNIFKSRKKKNKKVKRTTQEIGFLVEKFMARLEVAAEEDVKLNQQSKPTINKLKVLSKYDMS